MHRRPCGERYTSVTWLGPDFGGSSRCESAVKRRNRSATGGSGRLSARIMPISRPAPRSGTRVTPSGHERGSCHASPRHRATPTPSLRSSRVRSTRTRPPARRRPRRTGRRRAAHPVVLVHPDELLVRRGPEVEVGAGAQRMSGRHGQGEALVRHRGPVHLGRARSGGDEGEVVASLDHPVDERSSGVLIQRERHALGAPRGRRGAGPGRARCRTNAGSPAGRCLDPGCRTRRSRAGPRRVPWPPGGRARAAPGPGR